MGAGREEGGRLPALLALTGLLLALPAVGTVDRPAPRGAAVTSPGATAAPRSRPVHADDPPAGHTGGFGEDDCTVCHLDAGPDLPGGSLAIEGVPATYDPGAEYALAVVLRAEGTLRAGFQLAARHPDGSQAGDLRPVDGRVQILAPDTLRARYAAQTPEGSRPASSEQARWSVVWTAPVGGEEVRFHAAANSGNGDESPLGDLVFTARAGSTAPGGTPWEGPARPR